MSESDLLELHSLIFNLTGGYNTFSSYDGSVYIPFFHQRIALEWVSEYGALCALNDVVVEVRGQRVYLSWIK